MEISEIYDGLAELVLEIAQEAIDLLEHNIRTKGLILTEDLAKDFRYHIIRTATTVAAEIEFRQYGRFMDMRQLRYGSHMTPVEAMEFFIEKEGLDQFSYILGKDGARRSIPTVTNAVKRLAWTFAISRSRVPSVKRGYRGTWYNEGKVEIVRSAKKRLKWRLSELAAKYMAAQFQKEFGD